MIPQTNRLQFRKLTATDMEHLLTIYNDVTTMKYIPNSLTVWSKDELIQKFISNSANYDLGYGIYAVIDKETNKFIGQAGIYNSFNTNKQLEIGYILSSDVWNKGYGTEICRGLIKYCFEQLHASSVITRMYSTNTASARVSEKSGMTFREETELENQLFRSTYSIEL